MKLRSKRVVNPLHTSKPDEMNLHLLSVYCINKDLINIICAYLEPPIVVKSLLKDFSSRCKYYDGYALEVNYSKDCTKKYNYGPFNKHVFQSSERFIGNLGNVIYNKYSAQVATVPDRYYSSLMACDLS